MFAITRATLAGLFLGMDAVTVGAEPGATVEQPSRVNVLRVPNRGLQPQVAVDGKGIVHLIYFTGDPSAGDIGYVHSEDRGTTFSRPLRVNSQPGSAIALGNIRVPTWLSARRGASMSLGTDRARPSPKAPRVHPRCFIRALTTPVRRSSPNATSSSPLSASTEAARSRRTNPEMSTSPGTH